MTSESKDKITQLLAIIICIALNLSVLLVVTVTAFQTNVFKFLQIT